MRTIVFGLLLLLFVGCEKKSNEAKPSLAPGGYVTLAIRVESAQCGMCAATIEEALQKVEGVKKAEVDLDSKEATVEFLAAKANLGKLEEAITKAGYDANDKKADPEAYAKLDACCKVK